jgi:hypothetical protein
LYGDVVLGDGVLVRDGYGLVLEGVHVGDAVDEGDQRMDSGGIERLQVLAEPLHHKRLLLRHDGQAPVRRRLGRGAPVTRMSGRVFRKEKRRRLLGFYRVMSSSWSSWRGTTSDAAAGAVAARRRGRRVRSCRAAGPVDRRSRLAMVVGVLGFARIELYCWSVVRQGIPYKYIYGYGRDIIRI